MAGRNPRTGAVTSEPMGWRPLSASTPEAPTLGGSIRDWASTLPDRQRAQIEGRPYETTSGSPSMPGGAGGDDLGIPAAPAAPSMFRSDEPTGFGGSHDDPMALAMAQLEKSRTPMPGFEIDPNYDYKQDAPAFLAQGNARRIEQRGAEDAQNQIYAKNAMFGGPTVDDEIRADSATKGLQQARRMTDPAYARGQKQLDANAGAETYASKPMVAQRAMQREEGLTDAAAKQELALKFGLDPRALQLDERQYQQDVGVATAKNSLGMSLGVPAGGAPRGTGGKTVTQDQLSRVAAAEGMTLEEAAAKAQAEGYTIAP